MSTPLTLRTIHHPDGRPVLSARGEIDMSNLPEFRAALAAAVTGSGPIVVDLTAVDYLDSGAINALFVHAEHLHLICNRVLLPALRISGLTELATVEAPDAP
ncbi:STAS domain-containing protein [Frankia sp. CNm7]|uniref:STAS domain-containing protein n=1 Tax=Frankia nepalensis TaxID=1836974 RepID=A0A937RS94_9ACTN|nr:STAS domain-containing protein [Frankia nepalensis]MBL7497389.1 STAS domain-containing protein [Frankia nepalensis]MBL7512092.1 STAS domain-containing protein [Frankia nepalensis]MBL7523258.1 STAS domain-containing protein [Frankia nepalensis]MBL7631808.1 STAS domain-containing protein [Frankia nepalensis]